VNPLPTAPWDLLESYLHHFACIVYSVNTRYMYICIMYASTRRMPVCRRDCRDVCIEGVSNMLDKHQELVSYTKKRRTLHINVCPQALSVRGTAPVTQYLDFYLRRTLKDPYSAVSFNWKWRDTSPTYFLCLSNHSQSHRHLRKGAKVHGQTCPYVHCCMCKKFWTFVVNCSFDIRTKHLLNIGRVL